MKPYSKDFLTKIIETKWKTNESIQQIAERFGVSYSFVYRLIKRYEAVASVEPKPHAGGKLPLLNPQQIEIRAPINRRRQRCYLTAVKRPINRKNWDKSKHPNHLPPPFTKIRVN